MGEENTFIRITNGLFIRRDKILAVEAVPCDRDLDGNAKRNMYKVRIDVDVHGNQKDYFIFCKNEEEAQREAQRIIDHLS